MRITGRRLQWSRLARLVAACLLVVLAGLQGPGSIQAVAELAESPYTGLDLVLIVDQSGSMGGEAYGSTDHKTANDGNDLRFAGVQWAMDWLGSMRLIYGKDRGMDFRVAVLDFGDTVETRLEPTTIAPDSREQWEPKLKELQATLSAERFGKRNLGNTNPLLAFQKAREVFDLMDQQGDSGHRLRAILVVTDGIPYVVRPVDPRKPTAVPPAPGSPTATPTRVSSVPLAEYMTGLIKYTKENFASPDYSIYVLGVNDKERDQWGPVASYWRQVAGENVTLAPYNATYTANLQQFLGKMAHQVGLTEGELIPCGERLIPPYLQLIRFTIHKTSPADRVQIRVNNHDLDLNTAAKVDGANAVIETIEIPNPDPGTWNLICPANGRVDTQIYMEEVSAKADLKEPTGAKLQYLPSDIRLNLSGYEGTALPHYPDPKYQLTVQAGVVRPSGAITVPLQLDAEGYYSAPFTPTEVGTYSVRIAATTRNVDGSSLQLPLKLLPADPVVFTVSGTRPQLADVSETTVLVPAHVSLQVLNDQEQRIEPQVLQKLVTQAQITLEEPAGPRTFALQLQPDGTLAGSVTPLQAGELPLSLGATGGAAASQFNQRLNKSLKVSPLRVELVGLADPQAQYKSMNLVLRLLDQAGQPLMATADKTIGLEVTASLDGAGTDTVALAPGEDSTFVAPFRPQTAGDYLVHAVVKTTGAAARTIYDGDVGAFRVTPTSLVSVVLTAPKNGSALEYNKFLPFLKNSLALGIELQTSGQRADPASVLVDAGRLPFTLTLTETLTGAPGRNRAAELTLEPAGQPGAWRAYSKSITGRASYQVQVSGDAALKPAFVWDETPQSISFSRIPNRLLPLTYALAGLILVVAGVFAGRGVNNRFLQVKARGMLSIEDSNYHLIGTPCNLESRNLHSVAWNPNAPQADVKGVQVTGQANGVVARVKYSQGGGVTHSLTNGTRKPLKGGYWITYRDLGASGGVQQVKGW
jgi:hypothetical protein